MIFLRVKKQAHKNLVISIASFTREKYMFGKAHLQFYLMFYFERKSEGKYLYMVTPSFEGTLYMSLEMSGFHKRSSQLMKNIWKMLFLGKKKKLWSFSPEELFYTFQNQAVGEPLVPGTKPNIRDYGSDKLEFEF